MDRDYIASKNQPVLRTLCIPELVARSVSFYAFRIRFGRLIRAIICVLVISRNLATMALMFIDCC